MSPLDAQSAQSGGSGSSRPSGGDGELARQIADAVVQYPLPSHWKTIATASGDVYYWNRVTDQTTWQHPLRSAAGELLDALRDCTGAATGAPSAAVAALARKRRLGVWVTRWHDHACRELESWRSLGGEGGGPTYYYRAPSPNDASNASADSSTTWEDPRACLELRLRFQTETLAGLLSLPVPDVGVPSAGGGSGAPESVSGAASSSSGGSRRRQPQQRRAEAKHSNGEPVLEPRAELRGARPRPRSASGNLRLAEDGRWFQIEPLPADHSCGFHGLGISREDAAAALHRHRGDPAVEEYVAADLAAAIQSGERRSFPREIRDDDRLWGALDAYYAAQQALDTQRREAKELMAEDHRGTCGGERGAGGGDGGEVLEAVRRLFAELKAQASTMSSGPRKLGMMHRLSRYKTQAKTLEAAVTASAGAEQALRRRCRALFDEYVAWVGSDSLFWLSFIRSCGDSDRAAGGLLDALAKVQGLTVRVWAESSGGPGSSAISRAGESEEPELELVHTAAFGSKEIDLWFQGDRGHFDRLVLYEERSGGKNPLSWF